MEIVFIVLSFICIALAGVAEAIMDKLQFHFDKSIFADFKSKQWWNPIDSWKNKWKDGDKTQGEKFWLSSTILVFTTDAWHLFKAIRNLLKTLSLFFLLLFFEVPPPTAILITVAQWTIYSGVFEQTFKRLLSQTQLP